MTFNPYGQTVFLVVHDKPPGGTTVQQLARQVFITTGETRGDQVQVLTGIKQGDIVVTAGQIKASEQLTGGDRQQIPADERTEPDTA